MDVLSPDTSSSQPFRRRRTLSSSSSSSSSDMDADDSIVLSDLVRTGEASRLRRRGAMRVDRNSIHVHPLALRRRPGIFLEDSDSDEDYRPFSFAAGDILDRRHRAFSSRQYEHPSYSRWASEPDGDDTAVPYILTCGAELDDLPPLQKYYPPFEPSLFPVMPSERSSSPQVESYRNTNGCGSIIHYHGSCSQPDATNKTYVAKSRATDVVVPLADEYFSSHGGMKCETSPCGCVKEGIGCAVCGNPLGMRWRFCPRMAASRKPPSQRRRAGAAVEPEPELELYSFFSTAVTGEPDPAYQRPPTPDPVSPLSSPRFAPSSPQWRNLWMPEDDSDSENEIEFAQIVFEAREVRVNFPGPNRPTPMLPVLDRELTASPEPLLEEEAPSLLNLDADGNERTFESLMNALRNESNVVADSPPSAMPRTAQPLPQPMSFYEQQVLGAWERERDNEHRQEDEAQLPSPMPWYRPNDIRLSRTITLRDPVGESSALWDGLPSRRPEAAGGVTDADVAPPRRNLPFFDR